MSPNDETASRIARRIRSDGSVIVPPRIARWLESKTGMTAGRRINLRATDPEAYEVLAALHLSALQHRSGNGTEDTGAQGSSQESSAWITTVAAAAQLGVTDRCVRKWCKAGRLRAVMLGGRWLVDRNTLTLANTA